ncbi:hypothetical protein K7432_014359 [Basidiobolus ranarum]|uniref:Metallo-beta-lactamase domain-containing protein n=1 Tax=Basidiobolus ranarum TaxID=34480 RepID=A0ABR2VQ50_9FUNG
MFKSLITRTVNKQFNNVPTLVRQMATSSPAVTKSSSASPLVVPFFHKPSWTFTYIIADKKSSECAILDPCVDYATISGRISPKPLDDIINFVKSEGLNVKWLLDTHVHADHLSG